MDSSRCEWLSIAVESLQVRDCLHLPILFYLSLFLFLISSMILNLLHFFWCQFVVSSNWSFYSILKPFFFFHVSVNPIEKWNVQSMYVLSLCYSQFLCRILIWNSLLDKQRWRFGIWISKVARKPTVGLWNDANERTRTYSDSPGILFKFSRKGSAVLLR